MSEYTVVLYLHFLSLLVGIGAASVVFVCLLHLRAAETGESARPWGMLAGKTARAFPIAVLGLFATGAYMTSDIWSWDTAWIDIGIVGLAVLALQGPLLGERSAKRLQHVLRENGPGPLDPRVRRVARHPGFWITEFGNVGTALGVVFIMTTKPGVGGSLAAVAIGYVTGVLLALRVSRMPAAEAEAAEAAV